jgi:hypothetical protein
MAAHRSVPPHGTAKGGGRWATPFTCQLQVLAALCLSYRATTAFERADSGLVPTALMATTTKR